MNRQFDYMSEYGNKIDFKDSIICSSLGMYEGAVCISFLSNNENYFLLYDFRLKEIYLDRTYDEDTIFDEYWTDERIEELENKLNNLEIGDDEGSYNGYDYNIYEACNIIIDAMDEYSKYVINSKCQ